MIVDKLIKDNHDLYQQSIIHPLTNEILSGSLPDSKLYTYLSQDLKFFNLSLNLLGKALAYCDNPESTVTLGKQIGFLSHNENSYFKQVLHQLNSKGHNAQFQIPQVDEYLSYLKYLIYECESYVELITFIYTMEKVYLDWPKQTQSQIELPYKFQEWINLHSGSQFELWVQFLSMEIERVVNSNEALEICSKSFTKTVQLEIDFFQGCYQY